MATSLPEQQEFIGNEITEGDFKIALVNMLTYLIGLLGKDGGLHSQSGRYRQSPALYRRHGDHPVTRCRHGARGWLEPDRHQRYLVHRNDIPLYRRSHRRSGDLRHQGRRAGRHRL